MDAVLQSGAAGLRYFEVFLPRASAAAERWGADALPPYADIEARYFAERGIDLGALDADVEYLSRIATDLDDRYDEQAAVRTELAQAWVGAAAERADDHLAEHLDRADRVRAAAYAVRSALAEAARVLRAAGTRKADWVGGLDPSTAGGLTPDRVDRALADGGCDDDSLAQFVAHVRETLCRFTTLCDETTAAIDVVYRNLDCVFAGIDDGAFPVPAPIVVGCALPAPASACGPGSAATPVPGPPVSVTPSAATSLVGLGESVGVSAGPAAVTPVGGSLSFDAAVTASTVRSAGAVAGVVAQVALGIVDVVCEAVRDGSSLDLAPEAPCDCTCECACAPQEAECPPQPAAPTPPPAEAEETAPATPTEPDPDPDPEPESEPAPECPEPAYAAEPETPAAAPPPPVDYCVPAPESAAAEPSAPSAPPPVTPSTQARGVRPAPAARADEEPALAEAGTVPSAADDAAGTLAEAGPL